MQTACVAFVHYCQHCLPCPEGIEIGWVIWDLDQVPARGIEQIKEWYAEFPVKASAAPRRPTQRRLWASRAGCAWSAARLGWRSLPRCAKRRRCLMRKLPREYNIGQAKETSRLNAGLFPILLPRSQASQLLGRSGSLVNVQEATIRPSPGSPRAAAASPACRHTPTARRPCRPERQTHCTPQNGCACP
jgi:hypothetical protein